ncbi:extra-large guanine nucleotide-binding protein 2-like [Diospyros lotus]|uniref:extra-large guanine nucleotide-binding protein 2-like n=1 Tax=Diospyros lotus TaxID=55363 RepID=UPI0022596C9E|nr:extra-large guanine nucleotide-binding protein 2-like [Diospyros lotus]
MADKATLAKARRELEDLYSGIPDESVNLTFGDLAEVSKQNNRNSGPLHPVSEKKEETSPLTKLPSLDFSRGLEAAATDNHRHHHHHDDSAWSSKSHRQHHVIRHANHASGSQDDEMVSNVSGMTMSTYEQGGRRRRPGIPHSNICTVCSNYIYMCRNRCLVCGRVYCRQCVEIGMGEMTEGRKCIECLGRRFSQRYIHRAGQTGCCMRWRYQGIVMQQELKWAEKGPRRSGERRYGQSTMMVSRSRSPMTPSPRGHVDHGHSSSPSFVMNSPSPYSAYSPTNHPLPF